MKTELIQEVIALVNDYNSDEHIETGEFNAMEWADDAHKVFQRILADVCGGVEL